MCPWLISALLMGLLLVGLPGCSAGGAEDSGPSGAGAGPSSTGSGAASTAGPADTTGSGASATTQGGSSAQGGNGSGAQSSPGDPSSSGGGSSMPSNSGGSGATAAGSGPVDMGVPLGDGPRTIVVAPPGGAGSTDICAELEVNPMPVVPTVGILVDNSSSMFEPQDDPIWPVLYNTLMDPTTGVIQALQDKVRFGFASYKGSMATSEDDPACAEITSVPYDLNNYAAIDTVYTQLGAEYVGQTWETPTAFAVNWMAADLAAFMPDPPGPKYILMVTDGDPNTCAVLNPQCGQDAAIRAVQDAYALGIGTFVIGIGDIAANGSGCNNTAQIRCGVAHLQDIANAGLGLPVQDPPADYVYQPCIAGNQGGAGVLQATYASATGDTPGAATFYAAGNSDELRAAIEELLNAVLSCTFDMDVVVRGNAALGIVSVGGTDLVYEDPNGWTLEDNRYQVTLQGSACDAFQTGEQQLNITFPCDPSGNPIAVRR